MGGKKTDGREFDLSYAKSIAQNVVDDMAAKGIVSVIAGSVRRGKPTVHDIDIVVVWDSVAEKYCYERFGTLKNGKPKRSGIVDEINVELYPSTEPENWISNLATWTGSVQENIRLRSKSKRMGCTFSQNGFLDKEGKTVIFQDEEELYEYLGEKYLEPRDRS